MIRSMTGFGIAEGSLAQGGSCSIELRSTNHKFLETVLHLPEGFLAFEDRIKKEVEKKLCRGRVVCVFKVAAAMPADVRLDTALLGRYLEEIAHVQRRYRLAGAPSLETLLHLPGVVSLVERRTSRETLWPQLERLLARALTQLLRMRQKEGRALQRILRQYARTMQTEVGRIRARFCVVAKEKAAQLSTPDERASFLKNIDIAEELDRLDFFLRTFLEKCAGNSPVGKELDFIAQEMQRETNTMGAKSCDGPISAIVVGLKSKIEKLREQVQNIE